MNIFDVVTKSLADLDYYSSALETKAFDAATDDDPSYRLKGYASVFGNTDLDGDIIERGAFEKSLKSRTPLLLVNHKMTDLPAGTIDLCREDEKGLYFESSMPKDSRFVREELAPQLRHGSIKGVSIGFRSTKSEPIKGARGRRITEAELYEISVVNLPANPRAQVSRFKSLSANNILPISEAKGAWDAAAALERVRAYAASQDDAGACLESAFLTVKTENDDDDQDGTFLIADVENGCLKAHPIALFHAASRLMGHRDGANIDTELKQACRPALDAYYDAMGLRSAYECLSAKEYDLLDASAREARLRSLGLTPGLAKRLSARRDGGRSRRDGDVQEVAELKSAISEVRSLIEGLRTNAGPH